jgi:hypothetical protein
LLVARLGLEAEAGRIAALFSLVEGRLVRAVPLAQPSAAGS